MKRIKLSIAAFVAVAAIGLTIGTNAEAFAKKMRVTCFSTVTVFNSGSSGATTTYSSGGAITPDPDGKTVQSNSGSMNSTSCTGSSKFCCASIVDGVVDEVFQKSAS